MDEKQNNEARDWNGLEMWLAELIEQKKAEAKKWFIIAIISIAALVATNGYWIYQFTSYEYVSQDGSGINSINTGYQEDINYGTENED